MQNTRRWLQVAVWSCGLMLGLSVVLQTTFPRTIGPLPAGLRTPVLALELARSPAEIETMFGVAGSEQRALWVAQFDRGDAIDFAFIALYAAFLFAAARALSATRPVLARTAMGLALLAGTADVSENLCLFAITARLGGDYRGALSGLIAITWVKWLAIATCCALLSAPLRARGKWAALAGWIALLALPIALGAALVRGALAELMLLVITFAFVALGIEVVRALRAWRGANSLAPLLLVVLHAAVAVSACDSSAASKHPGVVERAPAKPSAPQLPPAETLKPDPAPPPASSLTRAAVDKLLETWLRAQNQGDFAQYAELYSAEFRGTRRTRETVKHLAHANWLEDRKRMFEKPMFVTMKAVAIGLKGAHASVDFVQTWSSIKYGDEGAKRMILRAEPAGARILSEDLLESRPAGAATPAALGMFLLVNAGSHTFAVLDGPIEGDFEAEPTFGGMRDDDTIAVSRALKPELRAKYADLEGLAVHLIANGKTCAAKLGAPAATKFVVPPDGDLSLELLRAAATKTPAQVAVAVKTLWFLEALPYVAAPVIGGCDGAVAAIRVGAKQPVVLQRQELKGKAAEGLLASFDAQPVGRGLAAAYAEYLRGTAPEEPHDPATLGFKQYKDAANAVVRFDRGGTPKFASVTWWYEGCAFDTNAFAITDLGGPAQWTERLRGIGTVVPLAIFDADGDGSFEAVVEDTWRIRRWLVRLGSGKEVLSSADITFLRCGC